MSTFVDNGPRTYVANQAISAYRAVVISTNGGVTYAGNAAIPDGVAIIDGASGDYIPVRGIYTTGTLKCAVTSTPVTVGDTLYAGASGFISTTGTITVGKSLTTTTSSGSIIEFIPKR